jgi:hypothetical protein
LLQKLEFLLFKLLEMAALSFSPRVTSVASSIIDRKYDNTIILGN